MRKQLYALTLILMLILGVYAAYYYSNYKVQNIPVRGIIKEMPRTEMIDSINKKPRADTNFVYAPLSPRYQQSPFKLGSKPIEVPNKEFSNANLIIRAGEFNDSTMGYIRREETRKFNNNYPHSTGFRNGDSYIFTHFHLEQVFRNNFKYYRKYLNFGGARVKAITQVPAESSPPIYEVRNYQPDSAFHHLITIKRFDGSRLVFAMPRNYNKSLNFLYNLSENQISQHKGDTITADKELVIPLVDFQLRNTYVMTNSLDNERPIQGFTKLTVIMNTRYNVLDKVNSEARADKRIHFNKPFLLYFQHSMTENPAFLCWVANPDLLLKKNRNNSEAF